MAETVREKILANIKSELEKISIENGYRNDIASVQRYMQHGNSLADVPCIIINSGPDKWSASDTVIIRASFTVLLDIWFRQNENDPTPTDKILNDLLADIYQCLWNDTTLGGYAEDIDFSGIDPFETIEGQPHSGGTIELTVTYRFLQADPEKTS